MKIFILDCTALQEKIAAHDYLASVFSFPDYYGKNLDALADCLGELGGRSCIILENVASVSADDYSGRVLDVIRSCAADGAFTLIEKM